MIPQPDGRSPPANGDLVDLDGLRDRLLDDAWLFDQPRAYRAGVNDALRNIRQLLDERSRR